MHVNWRKMAVLALLGVSAARSQGLGLDSLIGMALARSPDVSAGRQRIETAAQEIAAPYPSNPSLDVDAFHNLGAPSKPKASAKLSQELHFGARNRAHAVAESRVGEERERQRGRELDLISEIRSDYFAWQILNRKAILQSETAKRWEGLTRLATAKVTEGRVSQVDEAQAKLNLAKAKQRELELRTDKARLGIRLGYLAGAYPLPDSLRPDLPDSLPGLASQDSLTAWALQANPDLKTLRSELATGQSRIAWEQGQRLPVVSISAGYERESDGANLIGAGVEIPLALFNRNQTGIARARSERRETELRQVAAELALRAEISDAVEQLEGLAERYRNYQAEIRDLSRKQLALSEKGFREGLLGLFDLSRVQEEALAQESEALELLDAYYRIWNRLGRAVGGKTWER